MGCNCGGTKTPKENTSSNTQRSGTLQRVKETIKNAWDNTLAQPEQPTVIVKRINKK